MHRMLVTCAFVCRFGEVAFPCTTGWACCTCAFPFLVTSTYAPYALVWEWDGRIGQWGSKRTYSRSWMRVPHWK
ncbi:hypothetical protein A0H81_03381 [Grifola frondosa]|uniref:Uncharacterized protein n=1 Tax=Grifola frondosa TaxID=5627 RepID=A0A1C7MJP3_GRIFR|nr:hypothetical protein A0H81_03381 [Grifola frondosa]